MFNRKYLPLIILRNISPAIIAVVIASIAVLFCSRQIVKISKTIQEQKTLSRNIELRVESLNNLRRDFQTVGDADEKIKSALPPIDNILDFSSVLENLASKDSLSETINFESPSSSNISIDNTPLYVVNYDLTLNGGNITTLTNYLKKFEQLPYFTSASSVSLDSGANAGWDSNSTLVINAKIYAR
jgi:hypothetical protein